MKVKLLHPLWTHLPAVGALVFIIVYTIIMGPLPSNAPTHWDFHGQVDSYGSPYLGFWLTVGLSVLFIGITILFDELWAKHEKRKRFNWFSLLDELTVGYLVGIYTGYLQFLKSGETDFHFPWVLATIITVVLLIAAMALDMWRPYRPNPNRVTFKDTSEREKELAAKMKSSESFVYWESQNPWWVSLLSIGMTIFMVVVAAVTWFALWWVSLIVAISGLMMLFIYGGLQIMVTKQDITIKFGIIGLTVLRLNTIDIERIELTEFSPIADFGGYGIRYNGKAWGYYMQGNRGVKLTANNGKQYVIGSDKPGELYAVVQAVAGRK